MMLRRTAPHRSIYLHLFENLEEGALRYCFGISTRELPREDNFRPPSTSISRRCSGSQARNASECAPSEAGLEDLFVGLEGSPDLDRLLGALNVLDYLERDGPEGIVEDATSGIYLEVAGGEIREESEPEWLGVPMPGQFPVANWLTDKLNIPTRDPGSILLPSQPMEPQITHFDHCHLNLRSSSSPNFIDPHPEYLSLVPEERNTQALEVRSEKITPESPTQIQFVCSTSHTIDVMTKGITAHNVTGGSRKCET
ncbi:hypothetical protein K449DRAFT_460913 [Hypoxylon sp. EC38]|nr:hypothetical protein K449DRAFT_460913 [Hypoxylon sp. EC38]